MVYNQMKKSIVNSKSSDLGYEAIRQAIIDGRYKEGDRLVEAELAALAGISRTPIRDALRRLETEGFINMRPGSGAVVSQWTGPEVVDLFEIRAALECLGAGLAAQRVRAKDLDALSLMCDEMEAIAKAGRPDFLEYFSVLNTRFHSLILRVSGNSRLEEMATNLMKLGTMMRTYSNFDMVRIERSLSDHRNIVAALRAGSVTRTEATMRSHILSSIDTIEFSEKPNING